MATLAQTQAKMKEKVLQHKVVISYYEGDSPQVTFEGLWTRSLVDSAYRLLLKELRVHIAERRKQDNER